ncbi:hypothetical protein M4K86_05035 [Staphylococcus equorum]|uniref:hypothetical protein n=1 Tax=Staphylococcus equorum TaxID=246432 RepID=UPI002405E868|nr:hypothetical protein [Staphylococcus equorum]MDG0837309.1 hypothetical protein [Staphylococcus equorum]
MIDFLSRKSYSFISTLLIATIGYFFLGTQIIYLIDKGNDNLLNTSLIAFQILFIFLLDGIYQYSIYSYNSKNPDNKASSDFINLESSEIKVMSGFYAMVICLITYLNQINLWETQGFKQKGIITLFILFWAAYVWVFNSRSAFYNALKKDPLLFFDDKQDIKNITRNLFIRAFIIFPITLVLIVISYKLLGI